MKNPARRFALGAATALALLAVPAAAVPDGSVTAVDFSFSPLILVLTLDLTGGNDVTFANAGAFPHHPHSGVHGVPGEGVCFSSSVLASGASATVAIDPACAAALGPAGISYHCHIHPWMVGTVEILPA